ncbi:hypothetical protein MVEN_00599100 [Mycena venus]|uniref:Uncharacterized protein n=1 Tax=Mycena venus TaxID=2733690 RepID=A0A8H6YM75_9AGAR|nr:hypothetical protein MVEN_00599100 [Mycena venus]
MQACLRPLGVCSSSRFYASKYAILTRRLGTRNSHIPPPFPPPQNPQWVRLDALPDPVKNDHSDGVLETTGLPPAAVKQNESLTREAQSTPLDDILSVSEAQSSLAEQLSDRPTVKVKPFRMRPGQSSKMRNFLPYTDSLKEVILRDTDPKLVDVTPTLAGRRPPLLVFGHRTARNWAAGGRPAHSAGRRPPFLAFGNRPPRAAAHATTPASESTSTPTRVAPHERGPSSSVALVDLPPIPPGDVTGIQMWITTRASRYKGETNNKDENWRLGATIHFRTPAAAEDFRATPLLLEVSPPPSSTPLGSTNSISSTTAGRAQLRTFPSPEHAEEWSPDELVRLAGETPVWRHAAMTPPATLDPRALPFEVAESEDLDMEGVAVDASEEGANEETEEQEQLRERAEVLKSMWDRLETKIEPARQAPIDVEVDVSSSGVEIDGEQAEDARATSQSPTIRSSEGGAMWVKAAEREAGVDMEATQSQSQSVWLPKSDFTKKRRKEKAIFALTKVLAVLSANSNEGALAYRGEGAEGVSEAGMEVQGRSTDVEVDLDAHPPTPLTKEELKRRRKKGKIALRGLQSFLEGRDLDTAVEKELDEKETKKLLALAKAKEVQDDVVASKVGADTGETTAAAANDLLRSLLEVRGETRPVEKKLNRKEKRKEKQRLLALAMAKEVQDHDGVASNVDADIAQTVPSASAEEDTLDLGSLKQRAQQQLLSSPNDTSSILVSVPLHPVHDSDKHHTPQRVTRWLALRVPGSGVPVFASPPPEPDYASPAEAPEEEQDQGPEEQGGEEQDTSVELYTALLRKALARERALEASLRHARAEAQEGGRWRRRVRPRRRWVEEAEDELGVGEGESQGEEGGTGAWAYELHALVAFADTQAAARARTVVPVQVPAYADSGVRFVTEPWREALGGTPTVDPGSETMSHSDGAREGWARRLAREHRTEARAREREKERERQRGAAEGTWGKERLSEIRERLRRAQRREEWEREREAAWARGGAREAARLQVGEDTGMESAAAAGSEVSEDDSESDTDSEESSGSSSSSSDSSDSESEDSDSDSEESESEDLSLDEGEPSHQNDAEPASGPTPPSSLEPARALPYVARF